MQVLVGAMLLCVPHAGEMDFCKMPFMLAFAAWVPPCGALLTCLWSHITYLSTQ